MHSILGEGCFFLVFFIIRLESMTVRTETNIPIVKKMSIVNTRYEHQDMLLILTRDHHSDILLYVLNSDSWAWMNEYCIFNCFLIKQAQGALRLTVITVTVGSPQQFTVILIKFAQEFLRIILTNQIFLFKWFTKQTRMRNSANPDQEQFDLGLHF